MVNQRNWKTRFRGVEKFEETMKSKQNKKMKEKLAPIALFVYNRPRHTKQTIEALKKNELARESELFIFSDAPKNQNTAANVEKVKKYIRSIKDFKKIKIIEREKNFGLSKSIILGVTEIINKYGKVIVLEDDLVTSKYFLRFMNEALIFYENENDVSSINGYIYPIKNKLPPTFFLKRTSSWGWATWKRAWNLFEPDGQKLLNELRSRKLTKEFDVNCSYPFIKMLKHQIKGKNNSWAIRWYASSFLKNKLTLYSRSSLVKNIGLDSSGVHCQHSAIYGVEISNKPILLKKIPIKQNELALKEVEKYFKGIRWKRIIGRVKREIKGLKKVKNLLKKLIRI